jgi:glucan phosphoethanolaminetransferase (alkaline phosphatase superfamily)
MPYVNVPNDLSKIKTKMAFNLTKRQLVCFGSAAVAGVPAFLAVRGKIGNSGAMLAMIFLMLPFFFAAMYERDGLPFEKAARNIILSRLVRPPTRPYKTENYYTQWVILQEEAHYVPKTEKAKKRKNTTDRATDHTIPRNVSRRRLSG